MVKQTKQSTEVTSQKKEKSRGIFQTILLLVIIPLLFATAVFLIIAQVAGINVFDKAKEWSGNLPFVNEQREEPGEGDPVLEERVVSLQAEIQEKEAQLFKLQEELDKSTDEKEQLLLEQEKLQEEIEVLQREKDDSKKQFAEIVRTFEQMSAKSAAPVITNMSDAEAIQILTNLKPDDLAAILEKMTPEDAAKYTTMMTK